MVDIMKRRRIWFLISFLLLLPGIASLLVWKLNLGIEFKGGSIITFNQSSNMIEQGREQIEKSYSEERVETVSIDMNTISDKETRYYVKSASISQEEHTNIVRRLNEAQPAFQELSFESIDPQVGADVTRKAAWAIVVASLAIIAYITLSFRGIPKPASSWQFGIVAVVALLHDVLFILGFYSLMGHFVGWEVKAEFVTAALTVMGFSVHDTIVVFDRLRENLKRFPTASFRKIANISVAQTISRSINTSITVLFPLLAVALIGGETIRPFAITLFIGIAVGTYSSIFVATPLLDWWQTKKIVLNPRFIQSRLRSKRSQAVKTVQRRISDV